MILIFTHDARKMKKSRNIENRQQRSNLKLKLITLPAPQFAFQFGRKSFVSLLATVVLPTKRREISVC